MIENDIGLKLKYLKSDNNDEYYDKEFKEYCALNGIKHEFIISKTPQHNEVAKRMNMTIIK